MLLQFQKLGKGMSLTHRTSGFASLCFTSLSDSEWKVTRQGQARYAALRKAGAKATTVFVLEKPIGLNGFPILLLEYKRGPETDHLRSFVL